MIIATLAFILLVLTAATAIKLVSYANSLSKDRMLGPDVDHYSVRPKGSVEVFSLREPTLLYHSIAKLYQKKSS